MKSYWKKWLKAAGIRAIKTFGQAGSVSIPVTAVTLDSVEWKMVFGIAAASAIASLFTSLAGLPEVEKLD